MRLRAQPPTLDVNTRYRVGMMRLMNSILMCTKLLQSRANPDPQPGRRSLSHPGILGQAPVGTFQRSRTRWGNVCEIEGNRLSGGVMYCWRRSLMQLRPHVASLLGLDRTLCMVCWYCSKAVGQRCGNNRFCCRYHPVSSVRSSGT